MGRSMSSTAATSAVPMTANWTSCSGEQLTLAPRSSTVTTPPRRVGSCPAIAGRSMPGSVFSTKREIAISAPVLPGGNAGLRDLVLDEVDRDAHRRILLLAQRVGGRLVHLDDFARRMQGEPVQRRRLEPRERRLERRLLPDGDHPRIRRFLEELQRRRQRDRRDHGRPPSRRRLP